MQGQLSNLLDDIIDPNIALNPVPKLLDDVFTIVLNLYYIFNRPVADIIDNNTNQILNNNLNNDDTNNHITNLNEIVNDLNTNNNNLFHHTNDPLPDPFPGDVNYNYPLVNDAENRWIYSLSNLLFQLRQEIQIKENRLQKTKNKIMSIYKDLKLFLIQSPSKVNLITIKL